MVNAGGSPAQRFFNSIRNCTFDTGRGNPGAIGVRFNASNCGALRDLDSRGSVTISEANFGNNPYPVLVRDVRAGKTVCELMPGQTPGALDGSMIPFWSTP
jgi:hypothetical protein